jgi:phage terminase large subunit
MIVEKAVNPRFENFIFDWDYKIQLLVGGYGSSKSYHVVLKIILKLLKEKRKALVIREVYDTIRESCFDLFIEILSDLGLLEESGTKKISNKVIAKTSPMQLNFPNGSKVIFKGMDKPAKLKSINGISIIWIEEASEVKYAGYKELLGRLRHPTLSLHIILSLNPVGTDNWVYQHFFKHQDDEGNIITVLDDKKLYKKHTIIKNGVYYHHSVCEDNLFLPQSYVDELENMKTYDIDLWRIAKKGQFGINGTRVLPQFSVAPAAEVNKIVKGIDRVFHFHGMDFGFETSYNALVDMAVDNKNKILYIYGEYYKNHMTDDKTAKELAARGYKDVQIVADCAEPKTISFYQQSGFKMRPCHKSIGSRLSNTRKIKRFTKIICSQDCPNCIRELENLTYAKDNNGNQIFDEFNIDPHTFSAIWYGLDNYTVADAKTIARNSRRGGDAT